MHTETTTNAESAGLIKSCTTGDFRGIPLTGENITVKAISIQRIINNKMVEGITQIDTLGLLQQIGIVPMSLSELAEQHEAHSR